MYENIPRCAVTKEVLARSACLQFSTRLLRMVRMRTRMVTRSSSHIFRSSWLEDGCDDRTTVRRRVRVVGPDDALDLRQHACRLVPGGR